MRHIRLAATLSMILLLALLITACGGTRDEAVPQADDEPAQEAPVTQEGSSLGISSVKGLASDDVAIVAGEWGCDSCASVDRLAKALISGDAKYAIVPSDVAAQLYHATAGSVMAIDASSASGEPLSVTVVCTEHFGRSPEEVVGYVARHKELVEGAGATFYRGSAMQSALSDELADAYVEDASQVGGQLPPDNFYFLG